MLLSPFSGSYAPDDVAFLLQKLDLEPMDDIELKEQLIQSGRKHYSEMIGRERLPSPEYFELFERSLEVNAARVGRDLVSLAEQIVCRRGRDLVLVSLARAGTPFGVLLRRQLARQYAIRAPHYSVSIIRDRGIDANALSYIRFHHPASEIVFVDGWTGKGAISKELKRTLAECNARYGTDIRPELFVLVDLAGVATVAGSYHDYLIPSAILNAPVSGLVSRTILNEMIGPDEWHGCLYYQEWEDIDRSRDYIACILDATPSPAKAQVVTPSPEEVVERRDRMHRFVWTLLAERRVTNDNLVKPGIGEATRAVLRRAPEVVFVSEPYDPDVKHLVMLCQERGVSVMRREDMPVKAAAMIRSLGDV